MLQERSKEHPTISQFSELCIVDSTIAVAMEKVPLFQERDLG